MATCSACGDGLSAAAKFCSSCGQPVGRASLGRPVRKIVTVLFSDLADSTRLGERLDTEALRPLLNRYFAAMQAAVTRHGGVVEKYIGDAVMAVFGVPIRHEDDASRAVRAAWEMREQLEVLNNDFEREHGVRLAVRIGLHSGEILDQGVGAGTFLAQGDTANTAARLEQAAPHGEILLSQATYTLVRGAVDAEAVAPIVAKGKAEPLAAFRLLAVDEGRSTRAHRVDTALVGRAGEMSALRVAWRAACDGTAQLCVIVGEPGVGKSRMIAEAVSELGSAARVLTGRCLPYGQGITFWPLAEIVREAARVVDADSADSARAKIAALVAGHRAGEQIAAGVSELIGLAAPSRSQTEAFWAARELFVTLAQDGPLMVVIDDLHWAESTMFDLVDSIHASATGIPLLIVAAARPELEDVRPDFATADRCSRVLLGPLDNGLIAQLVDDLVPSIPRKLRDRLVVIAGGNALFAEEIVAMLLDEGVFDDQAETLARVDVEQISIPSTIATLLGARLDRLGVEERAVLEGAAVVGQRFWRGAVEHLAPPDSLAGLADHLLALMRRELIRTTGESVFGDEEWTFRHLLVRDTAYSSMTKELRAELHEQFASWLEQYVGDRVDEYEAIIGYHLEAAWRYRADLSLPTPAMAELGARAASWLTRAGRHSSARTDLVATINLYARAVELLGDPHERARILPELAAACFDAGDIERATRFRDEARVAVGIAGDRMLSARATISLTRFAEFSEEQGWADATAAAARELLDFSTSLGDAEGLAEAWHVLYIVEQASGRLSSALDCLSRAIGHARDAGSFRFIEKASTNMALLMAWGPTPTSEGLRVCRELLDEASGHPLAHAHILIPLALFEASRSDFVDAREHVRTASDTLEELGRRLDVGIAQTMLSEVEYLAGDIVAAEVAARRALAVFREAGAPRDAREAARMLARAAMEQDRCDEAERVLDENDGEDHDGLVVIMRARLAARRGEYELAERLAREERGGWSHRTGVSYDQGEILFALAEVQALAGKHEDARAMLADVLAWSEVKEHLVFRERAARLLEEYGRPGPERRAPST